jgi:polyprenyldihydroxybenzoate methyltransferase / 3-demethylubiquinol 3-O-methyltransferase
MNPLRFDFISSLLPIASKNSYSYLDIGCGGGIFASACARHPLTSKVTAIDPTPACIEAAQAHQRTDPAIMPPRLTYLNTAIESLPADTEGNTQKYDIITLFEVLEHIASPSEFLTTAAKHLKPGGWVVGSTIARSPMSFITTKLIAEAPIIGVVPAGTHDWNQYINPGELRAWFEKSSEWNSFTTQGVVYVPGLGWKVVPGSEGWGNYFFGVQKLPQAEESVSEPPKT